MKHSLLIALAFLFGSQSFAWSQDKTVLEICPASTESVEGFREFQRDGKPPIFVDPSPVIREFDIESLDVKEDQSGKSLYLRLTKAGGEKLATASEANFKKPMAILFEGSLISAPIIQSKLGREVMISGDFTDDQIEEMKTALQPRLKVAAFDPESLDVFSKRLDRALERRVFSGAVLIAVDGRIVFEKSVGFANIDDEKPFAKNSSFRLASVSKQFTAMGIMLLKEEGKLNYDDDIRKHLPSLPWDGITIRHLLHHNGGLPDYMGIFDKHWDKGVEVAKKKTAFNADAVKLFSDHKPKQIFAPGSRHMYSNTGYVFLGSIIEAASGQSIHEFFRTRIFEPLEMRDSFAFSPDEKIFNPSNRVFGFGWSGADTYANDWHYLNGMIGDGGVYASARDLLKWDQALYGEKLVSQATLDEAFSSGTLNDGSETGYGFGWVVENSEDEGLVVSHGGHWVGFRTSITRKPERRLTVIVLSNNSTSELDRIVDVIGEMQAD